MTLTSNNHMTLMSNNNMTLYDKLCKTIFMQVNNVPINSLCLYATNIKTLIRAFPEKQWEWNTLSHNKYLTMDIVKENIDKPWNWLELSKNPLLTWDIIKEHLDKPWNWIWISQHPNITWDIIQMHPEIRWDWYSICKNPNITRDIVKAHPEKYWVYATLLAISPHFFEPTDNEKESFYRKTFAVRRIWKAWFRAITNPEFALCKRRLMQEYTELYN